MTIIFSIYASNNCTGQIIASMKKYGIQGVCFVTDAGAISMGCVDSTGGYFINEFDDETDCHSSASTAYEVQDATTCVALNDLSMTRKTIFSSSQK